jgi:type VI secretion system protein ImpL
MPTLYIILAVALVALVVLVVLYLAQKKKQARAAAGSAEDSAPGGDEISILIREAEAKLAGAKIEGARVSTLPVYLLLGDSSCAKTCTVVHSGLEPELLAGQVYQAGNITATRTANFWFSRRSIFIEAGGKLPADAAKWHRLVQKLQPRGSVVGKGEQAPRAAVVFFDCENFTRAGAADQAAAAARTLRARLGEICQTMGIKLPVYVLFSKMDRLPFFTDFVRNLSNEEATQVLGITLPMILKRNEGVYGEEETARLTGNFEWLFRSLADARPEFLAREAEAARLPGAYEFPREFRKIRAAAVQFMVDLCRPSQLSVGPFLRGFYFSGVRPIIVNEAAPVAAAPQQPGGYGSAAGATGIFSAGARPQPPAAPAPVGVARKVPQWLFLSHFFNDVLLADRAALGASGSSVKTSFARRLLFIAAAALCIVALGCFTLSFFNNRGLEAEVHDAAQGLAGVDMSSADLAPLAALQKLESLRQAMEKLVLWRREHPPLGYRFGLYTGDDLYPEARRLYFQRFQQVLFGQTQSADLQSLRALPLGASSGAPSGPGPEYGPTYDALKAYLITTNHHEKSTKEFLTPVLMKWWMNGRTVDPERAQLASRQFDFYAVQLQEENPYSNQADDAAVDKARRYLAQFAGEERVYAFMVSEAGKSNPPIDFARQFPNAAQIVMEPHIIPGAFSKGGWNFMKDAIAHADRYFNGEQWVLGDQASANIDRAKLAQDLRARYNADFTKEWRDYIKSASVARYAGLKDASDKLMQISGNQSPLLELFALASQNTAVDDPSVANLFQPVQAVVPPTATDRFIQPPNQNYMNALVQLQTSLETIASKPGTVSDADAAPTLANAQQAIVNTRQLAQTFRIDSEGHIETAAQKLLEDPITNAQGLLRALGPAELNGKGKDLCAEMRPLFAKYPFSPNATAQATLQDIDAIFKPKEGALWAFYDANLQKVIARQGSQFAPAGGGGGITINPAFLGFLNRAGQFTDLAYANNSPDPHFTYTVKPVVSPDTDTIKLVIDGQTADFNAAGAGKQFTWPGAAHGVQLTVKFKGSTPYEYPSYDGLWAVFQFVGDADKRVGSQIEMALRAGRQGRAVLYNSQPVIVRFDLAANPPVFDKGYFTGLACVAEVAKP